MHLTLKHKAISVFRYNMVICFDINHECVYANDRA